MAPSCALFGGFAIRARVALLWQHYGNAWQSPAVIRQAQRTPHACRTRTLRMPAKTPLAGDNLNAPAACAVPFRPHRGGAVTRTRNVSEYMLVLVLCLVVVSYQQCASVCRCVCQFPQRRILSSTHRHHRQLGQGTRPFVDTQDR